MITEFMSFVQSMQDGAAADPTGTLILVAIGVVAVLFTIVAMLR